MDLQLKGASVIIAGGAGPIGAAIARTFLDEGARVMVGLRTASGDQLPDHIPSIDVDLESDSGPTELMAAGLRAHKRIDLLINNVGPIVLRPGGFLRTSEEDATDAFTSNLLTPWRICQAVLPLMVEQHAGTIINLASVVAQQPVHQLIHYSAAKAALINMSKALAQEFAPFGIRVNVVSPAPVATQTTPPVLEFDYPSGRPNTPEEVATLVAFVASPRLGNITGINYRVDGGLVATVV